MVITAVISQPLGNGGLAPRFVSKTMTRYQKEDKTVIQFTATTVEVALTDALARTRVTTDVLEEPGDGELILAVELFGLSGNNISYAQLGNQFGLGYWRPFPAQDGWGRVPAWGIARVLAGDPALAQVGDRFVGLVPMADRMRLQAAPTATGLRDTSAEREGMLPLYRDMRSVASDPGWREDLLDVHLLLRPAYPPAALLDDELAKAGTQRVLLTSATSKTALMTARLLSRRGVDVTGLTSAAHLDAAVATGAYSSVRSYDEIDDLPVQAVVLLDIAGNPAILEAVHARFGDDLIRHLGVGGTHHGAAAAALAAPASAAPGPEMFNTGAREVELADEHGEQEVLRLEDAARDLLVPWAASWMEVRTVTGANDVENEWRRLTTNSSTASPLTGTTAAV